MREDHDALRHTATMTAPTLCVLGRRSPQFNSSCISWTLYSDDASDTKMCGLSPIGFCCGCCCCINGDWNKLERLSPRLINATLSSYTRRANQIIL